MNDASQENEIIRRWRAGQAQRSIARELGINRKRVARVVREHRQARDSGGVHPDLPGPRKSRRGRRLAAFEPALRDLLERYPEITVVRLLEELRGKGYRGSYTVLREQVRQWRSRPAQPPVIRFETPPGAQAQMDWGTYEIDFTLEGRRRVELFSYLLSYSRRQYLNFTEQQDMENTLRQHVRGFEYLDGVGRDLSVRQFQSRRPALGGRPSGLQHPLPGVRHPLWLPTGGLSASAARNEGQSGTCVSLCRKELAQRSHVSLAGTSERSHPLVVGERRRRASASRDEETAHRRVRRGTAAPVVLAGPRLRYGPGRLSDGQPGRLDRLSAEPLFGALAVHRRTAARAGHRGRTAGLQQPVGDDRPASAAAPAGQRPDATRSRPSGPAQPAGPSGAPAATLRGTGRRGAPLPGRTPAAATVRQTSGRAGVGLTAHLAAGRSAGGDGTCRPLPRLCAEFAWNASWPSKPPPKLPGRRWDPHAQPPRPDLPPGETIPPRDSREYQHLLFDEPAAEHETTPDAPSAEPPLPEESPDEPPPPAALDP